MNRHASIECVDRDEGSWDLHCADVVVALSRDEEGGWTFWDMTIGGITLGCKQTVNDDKTKAALDALVEESRDRG